MITTAAADRPAGWRIGIDVGGTKIAGVLLNGVGAERTALRITSPRNDYAETIAAICQVAERLASLAPHVPTVGVGIPGSVSPVSGLVQNANSTWLNGRPLHVDLAAAIGRPVRLANDANCFALSEVTDGAAQGAASVFGVILGTGCGGGFVTAGRLVDGPRGIGGEWGHNPLPWADASEFPGRRCWCGRQGCMETWVSGPALAADHIAHGGASERVEDIVAAANAGDHNAKATLARHASRLARGLAHVVNIIDPHVVVLGGGLSKLPHLYDVLPHLIRPHVFADTSTIDIRPPRWGDASGVRGAAWLWDSRAPGLTSG